MAAAPTAPREARASLRTVALAAKVSAMTVSRALRNHPKVSARTRTRIQRLARELGYRPDPHVAKLMHHLRLRRKPAFQSSICALTTNPGDRHPPYLVGVLTGARRRADALGHGFTLVHVDPAGLSRPALQRMLHSRGVEGVILLPMAVPMALPDLLDWREFSVVATTTSVLAPEVNIVAPHHFKNMQFLVRELTARGYRRIGLALPGDHVRRVNHAYNAALAWEGLCGRTEFVAPLVYEMPRPKNLEAWFARERPDVIVTHNLKQSVLFAQLLGLRRPGRVGFATTSVSDVAEGLAGIDEIPVEIGAVAVDQLTGMIQRGVKGVPALPTMTQLLGRWSDGRSCPRRRTKEIPARAASVSPLASSGR